MFLFSYSCFAQVSIEKVKPRGKVGLREGDILQIEVKASPSLDAGFKLGPDNPRQPLFENKPGVYKGSYRIQAGKDFKNRDLIISLKNNEKTVTEKAAKITVLSGSNPRVLKVRDKSNLVLRTGPGIHWERLTHEVFAGTRFQVVGFLNDWYEIKLSEEQNAWINQDYVKLLPRGSSLAESSLQEIYTQAQEDTTEVRIKVTEKVSAQVISELRNKVLKVRLFNITQGVDPYYFDPNDKIIDQVTAVQNSEKVIDLYINLQKGNISGYKIEHSENYIIIKLKKPFSPKLQDKKIIIDPGHGGTPGAVGPAGTEEAKINLAVAKKLKNKLEAAGVKVVMTRFSDGYVHAEGGAKDLYERVEIAEEREGDFFISIHANSAPGESGRRAQGNEGYFYYPIGGSPSRLIQSELTQSLGNTPRFYAHRSLAVIRNTFMPSILVEMGFLSNPDFEKSINTSKTQNKVAEGLYNGIEKYFKKYGTREGKITFPEYTSLMGGLKFLKENNHYKTEINYHLKGTIPAGENKILWGINYKTRSSGISGYEIGYSHELYNSLRGEFIYKRFQDNSSDFKEALLGIMKEKSHFKYGSFLGINRNIKNNSSDFKFTFAATTVKPLHDKVGLILSGESSWIPSRHNFKFQFNSGLGWTF